MIERRIEACCKPVLRDLGWEDGRKQAADNQPQVLRQARHVRARFSTLHAKKATYHDANAVAA